MSHRFNSFTRNSTSHSNESHYSRRPNYRGHNSRHPKPSGRSIYVNVILKGRPAECYVKMQKIAAIVRNFLHSFVSFIKKKQRTSNRKDILTKLAQNFSNRKISLFLLSKKFVVKVDQLKVASNVNTYFLFL